MIVVLEGISAAGKTTYARGFGAAHHVPEFPEHGIAPGADDPAEAHAHYWIAHNIRRFQAALEVEATHGFAICDTDPFRSHYDWCMAQAGFAGPEIFTAAVPLAREAIARRDLGFGDLYLVKPIAPADARAQKERDTTRTRRRFDVHLALQPHLLRWYEALDLALPAQVEFGFPDPDDVLTRIKTQRVQRDPWRFDASVLDALLSALEP